MTDPGEVIARLKNGSLLICEGAGSDDGCGGEGYTDGGTTVCGFCFGAGVMTPELRSALDDAYIDKVIATPDDVILANSDPAEIAKVRAEIRSAVVEAKRHADAEAEWQPIETAPERVVILCAAHVGQAFTLMKVKGEFVHWPNSWDTYRQKRMTYNSPTHWMHLPEPPPSAGDDAKSRVRRAWDQAKAGTHCMTEESFTKEPHINWRHIDGPLMTWAGQMYWLNWRERLMLWLSLTTERTIAENRFGRSGKLPGMF